MQEENGDANGDVEVNLAFSVWPRMFWFEIWPTRGPVSVYDMLDQPDSEPLAGPTQWTWSLKRVRHWSLSTDVLWHLIKAQPIENQEGDMSWPNRISLQVENGEADTPVVKKKKKKQAVEEMEVEAEEAPEAENGAEDTPAKKKKKRKSEAEGAAATDNGAEETETPAKKKKKQKTETVEEPEEETPEPPVSEKKKKKKKKEGAD